VVSAKALSTPFSFRKSDLVCRYQAYKLIVSLHNNRSAINSAVSFTKWCSVYIAFADWEQIQYSVLLRTRSRIFVQNRRSDADSKFRDPHTSELSTRVTAIRLVDLSLWTAWKHVQCTTMRSFITDTRQLAEKCRSLPDTGQSRKCNSVVNNYCCFCFKFLLPTDYC